MKYRPTPHIVLINKAKTDLGFDINKLADVLYRQVKWHFNPVWGINCTVSVEKDYVPDAWAMTFFDVADQPNALGYHDLTPGGLPLSKIFVKTILDDNASVSVTASHEILEMLLDPAINLVAFGPNGKLYAYEASDACEEETYKIDDIEVSDFVFPSWFEDFRAVGSTQFDYLGKIKKPFQILPGGYMSIMDPKGTWTEIFGSERKAERFAQENRQGHRSEFRKLKLGQPGDM